MSNLLQKRTSNFYLLALQKVDACRVSNAYFLILVHFSQDMKYAISTRWLANPNQGH